MSRSKLNQLQKAKEESSRINFKEISYLIVGDLKPTKKKVDQAKT